MNGLIAPSDVKITSDVEVSLSCVQKHLRDAVDLLLLGNKEQGIEVILSAYQLFNEYACSCAYNPEWKVSSESTRQWDSAFAALLGLTAQLIKEPSLIKGLMKILSGREIDQEIREVLYIVASGGEYKYRTLFVTLAVGILCSLFYPTEVHGNRSVTGCGCGKFAEADILESYTKDRPFPLEPLVDGVSSYVDEQLVKHNFAFSYTQAAYPIFWRFAASRGNAGLREPLKLAGTLASPYRSRYAYMGLWSAELFDVAHQACSDLYENFVLVVGPDNLCDEMLPSGGKFRYKGSAAKDVTHGFQNVADWSVIETEDGIPVSEELQRLSSILAPDAIDSGDLLTRIRCEMAIVNAAYALSVLPQNNEKSIETLKDEIKTKISNGEAAKKLEGLKSLACAE